MGIMIDGQWHTDDDTWAAKDGTFQRAQTQFHDTIGTEAIPAEWDRYQQPGIANTVDLNHIKQHYYYSHATVNPIQPELYPKGYHSIL